MRDVCVCVFAKPAKPGRAKTRLAPRLGNDGAAALAHAFFLDTWATCSQLSWAETVLATTNVASREWKGVPRNRVWAQGRGTLGDRLERTLRRALRSWPGAIAIGTDLPGLPPALLDSARQALQRADAVLGPVDDGASTYLGFARVRSAYWRICRGARPTPSRARLIGCGLAVCR